MDTGSIKLGVVVRHRYGGVGIVCAEEVVPPGDWIDDQLNAADIKALDTTDWWGVLLFQGGKALSPGALLKFERDATYEDFLQAVDMASVTGRQRLAKLFPEYVERVIAEQRASKGEHE